MPMRSRKARHIERIGSGANSRQRCRRRRSIHQPPAARRLKKKTPVSHARATTSAEFQAVFAATVPVFQRFAGEFKTVSRPVAATTDECSGAYCELLRYAKVTSGA